MKKYFMRLITLCVGLAIFFGIPYLIGDWFWLFFSWLPAVFAMASLETD